MPSIRTRKSTQGEHITSLAALKKGDQYVTAAPNLPDGHQPDGFWVHHNVTRSPMYVRNKTDWDDVELPQNWPADWGPQDEVADNPLYMVDLYNPGPGRVSERGHYQLDVPVEEETEGRLDFVTGKPASLGPSIHKAAKLAHHKRSRKDARPKTAVGGLVRDLRRIVPDGGDPATNDFYVNSVARAVQEGAVQTSQQAFSERLRRLTIERYKNKPKRKTLRSGPFSIME